MGAPGAASWLLELERPTEGFFRAFAARCQEPGGPRGAAREAVTRLTPLVDWAAYLPHIPHGLLGLQAVFRLEPLLAEPSFLRILATQLHAFALEARSPKGHGLGCIGTGSGHWGNLQMALQSHRPAIAWGEALGVAEPAVADFRRLEQWAEADMANVGHKPLMARGLADLATALDDPGATRLLLALAAWLCASEPFDTFWHDRAHHRLEGAAAVPCRPAAASGAVHAAGAREVCDSGLVELLDRFAAKVRATAGSGDLLAMLALAAADKQLDARRDLEGKTSWNFTYLAALARRALEAGQGVPESWVQGAALVNLFPTGEDDERPRPVAPRVAPSDEATGLLDALLDGEPLQAMFLAEAVLAHLGPQAVLAILAEAASTNDPAFNHSHQLLAVGAVAELLVHLPEAVQATVLVALAKFLGNSQGSSDLGRLADAALRLAQSRAQ
jgi:hypothetical protein